VFFHPKQQRSLLQTWYNILADLTNEQDGSEKNIFRVTTPLKNMENLEKSGNSKVVREDEKRSGN